MATTLEIQRALLARGYDPGPLDGIDGAQTKRAVIAFQRAAGLDDDGLVGSLTWAALTAGLQGLMTVSAAGRKAIAEHEGVRLKAYQDSVGIWTIGVGHTAAAGPPIVSPGMTITAEECDRILSRDLAKFEAAVRDALKVPVARHEFDALVSLAFNIGGSAFSRSTLVRLLNAGDRKGAADAFLVWNKAGGRVLAGLNKRRSDERKQFLGDRT